MNERIGQLCQQKADYWMNHYDRKSLADMSLLYNDVEKFAELIVGECAEHALTFNNNLQSLNDKEIRSHSSRVSDYIKDRMGVEN